MPATMIRRRSPRSRRRGTATVELAVCLPVLTLLVFGSMQACDMIYLKHSLMTAAYEGSLEVARPDSSSSNVQGRVEQVMEIRGVEGGSCDIDSSKAIESLAPGDVVTLQVKAPVKANLKFPPFFGTPSEIEIDFQCTR